MIVAFAITLRIPGFFWLYGVGVTSDFSFMTDDQRFVDLAKNFKAGTVDGYVYGMTTHALALRTLLSPFVAEPNFLQLLRVITVAGAALTVLLTVAFARLWGLDSRRALLAAFFLATAPTYIAISNFGTADVAGTFYFLLTLFVGVKFLQTRDQLWFVLAATLAGAAFAIKLFLALLPAVGLLVLLHRGRMLITQGITALLVFAGSFEFFSFFSYAPWDFTTFVGELQATVVSITGGNGLIRQIVLYIWDLPSALSIPVAILLTIGAAIVISEGAKWVKHRRWSANTFRCWRSLITPTSFLLLAFGGHALILLSAGTHVVRHQVLFFPVMCVIAAHALLTILDRIPKQTSVRVAVVSAVIIYCGANAVAVQMLFLRDIRAEVSTWVNEATAQGKTVHTFSEWMRIKNVEHGLYADPRSFDAATYIVTCDLEYIAHIRNRDADVYAPLGGQRLTDFFWDVFEDKASFGVVRKVSQEPLSLEQKLIDAEVLRPIGSFVPKTCLMLAQDKTAKLALARDEVWPRLYYTVGW